MEILEEKILNEIKLFYTEHPKYYFFDINVVKELISHNRTLFELKRIFERLHVEKTIEGTLSMNQLLYNDWLNKELEDIDLELFSYNGFKIGQKIKYYREYFGVYEETKSVSESATKIEFKAYGRSRKIRRDKIAFIGYFENDILKKFENKTNAAKAFEKSDPLEDDGVFFTYYEDERLLTYIFQNNLQNFVPSVTKNVIENTLLVFEDSANHFQHLISTATLYYSRNNSVLYKSGEGIEEGVEILKAGLEDFGKGMDDITKYLQDLQAGKSVNTYHNKTTFENYFGKNRERFKKKEYFKRKEINRRYYYLISDLIRFFKEDLSSYSEMISTSKMTEISKDFITNEIQNEFQRLEVAYDNLIELNKNKTQKHVQKIIIRNIVVISIIAFVCYLIFGR